MCVYKETQYHWLQRHMRRLSSEVVCAGKGLKAIYVSADKESQ
jgi:hypothetical protein